ncbi:hypothetical protein [Campylobacter rectus]|uniref:hypothetical protein n=1 Tax=Campylobacter rectus TaxID=203 RepID=UPI000F5F3836|nr:hypothetical protein [Campylobacter rectus]RRD52081.1 hypothetical protein EII16_11500 [Campylobacter rectus]
MSDINLTQDQRDSYIEVITQILGVNAVNVTADNLDLEIVTEVDNLDLEIVTEVDNFIKEAQDCTKRIRIVTNLFKSLTDIRKLAFAVVKEIVKGIKNSYIWAPCYFVLKPKYVGIIGGLFAKKGGGTGVVY